MEPERKPAARGELPERIAERIEVGDDVDGRRRSKSTATSSQMSLRHRLR